MTYQWQRSKDEGKTWTDISGETSETLNVTIQSSDFGSQYRCIAKDLMGHVATSQAGKLASSIASQSAWDPEYTIINEPDDYYGRPGDIATFIVEAEGKNLSYQWLYQAPGSDEFVYCTSSDATTNTLRVEMTTESDGAQYRCFITDANGDMGSTRIATIKLDILDWEMEYNTSGIRTKRVSEEKTYNYIYAGDKLMRMTVGNDTLDFNYDVNGVPLTMTYNGTVYYYTTNLQGDVISLERADGGGGAQYAYDAWGNIIAMSGTLAELNPLRYRGYVYDQETGFYYLNSRYYDPAVGRFINPDSLLNQESALGNNMFAYCLNNPMNMTDTEGNLPFLAVTAIIGAVVGAVAGGVVAAKSGGNVWAGIGIGAVAGALVGTGVGMAAGAALAGSITATTGAVMTGGSALLSTVATGGFGAGVSYISNNLSRSVNNATPAVQTAAEKMRAVAAKGKAGEMASGLVKNTQRIYITATKYRIPDGLDAANKILSEVKNYSGTLSYTAQLRDFVSWSQANGYQMHLYTNAHLTGPLQQAVDSGLIQIFPLK